LEGIDQNMSSSRIISLFSERPELTQRPSSFVFSVLAHGVAIAVLSFGIIYTPEIRQPLVTKRYSVRHLDIHTPQDQLRHSAAQGISYPGSNENANKPPPGPKAATHPAVLRQTADAKRGPQTLIQPDIKDPVKLTQETPLPTVVIWTPKKDAVKNIVAPLPEKATASDVKPSVNAPNDEINLGDMGISSTKMATDHFPVFPTTTSPLVVHGPNMVQLPPVTTSQTSAQPTPTPVLSISDLHMAEGTITLPPVNQTTDKNEAGILAPGQAAAGHAPEKAGGAGAVQGTGDAGKPNGVAGNKAGTNPAATASPTAAARPATAASPATTTGAGSDDGLTTEHFTLPKNGEFGAVVVGASLDEKFPELSGIWNDRVAYTVYLHVGLAKSWILQYSLPRSVEAAQSGNVARLEAPWPYNIVRPNIPPGSFSSDAILVHGFVNQGGRFETLSITFPPDYQQGQFVIDALNQWQFRPAVENGQTEKVEVLLIIPEED
jgi:hypothetical protein